MSKPRLNIFALPNQTSVIFWLITGVLLGTVAIGSTGVRVFPFHVLALLLWILPLREFLVSPQRKIRTHRLRPLQDGMFPLLQRHVADIAGKIGLSRVPQILLDPKRNEVYTLGSFRRWYVVWGQEQARSLEDALATPEEQAAAEAQIIHELYHFKNGDALQLGYLEALLKTGLQLMLWALLFLVGWIFLLIVLARAFLQRPPNAMLDVFPLELRQAMEPVFQSFFAPERIRLMQQKIATINLGQVALSVAYSTIPYIILILILWRFYYPRLWRMREYYADAGVLAEQRGTDGLLQFTRLLIQQSEGNEYTSTLHVVRTVLRKLIIGGNYWPPYSRRLGALQKPGKYVFYSQREIAVFLGGLVLILEILMASVPALPFTGEHPLLVPTLLTIVGLTYFLLPHLVMGKSVIREAVWILLGITGIYCTWLVLTLMALWGMYFTVPGFLNEMLSSAIAATAGYAGHDVPQINILDFLLRTTAVQILEVVLIVVLQGLAIWLLLTAIERMLQWYPWLSTPRRFKVGVFRLMAGTAGVFALLILPIGENLIGAGISGLSTGKLILGALLLVVGSIWFYTQDKSYYARCPSCSRKVSSRFSLGKTCASCGTFLLPWIVTNDEI